MAKRQKQIGWLILWSLILSAFLAMDHWAATAALNSKLERDYPAPSYIDYETDLTDEQLLQLGRYQARQVNTLAGRLGVIEPGKKGLITIRDDQDLRVVEACIKALQERGADADYLFTSDMLEMYGYQREWWKPATDVLEPEIRPLMWELKSYFSGGLGFFSEEARKLVPQENEDLIIHEQKAFNAKMDALKKHLKAHPEYEYVFLDWSPGGPEFSRLSIELGSKFHIAWRIPTVAALAKQGALPGEIWSALQDKALEVIPWIEHVRVTDAEGTDVEWSVTSEEAKIWRTGAFLPDYIRMYPLQANRYLSLSHGINRLVAPETKGVIAGTMGHGHYFPRVEMTIEHGMVQKIEGGGLRGDLMRDLLEKYKDNQLPGLPYPGWFYVFQIMLNTNPLTGSGGSMVWGFGAELYTPEIREYVKKHGMLIAHDMHMNQNFPTYEATVSGGKKIKVLDKGHLVATQDPEVRMIASKYGDPDRFLRKMNQRAIPGINAPGSYEEYAKDPWQYVVKEREQIREGTYPYTVKMLPLQLQLEKP